jgi:hypothetical protein
MTQPSEIDVEAKLRIPIYKRTNQYGEFYLGKIQFPGTIHLSAGVSFMVFSGEEDCEEIHIGFMKNNASSDSHTIMGGNNGGIAIDLCKRVDGNGNVIHIGDLKGPVDMPVINGLFFKVILSEGNEEIIISPLDFEARRRRQQRFQEQRTYEAKVG